MATPKKKMKLATITDKQLDMLIDNCKQRRKIEFGVAVMYFDPAFIHALAVEVKKGRANA